MADRKGGVLWLKLGRQGRPTSEGGDGPPGEAIGGGARWWRDREGAVNRRARGRERGGGGGKGDR
ncbi:UNVERIFIED_CONTAM: hypothetical protein Sradi_3546600 [Sesamum radiatum]|uniref:Uncharacterized protein n=1 Tax=Sesamum radiatum TaxID=300843 RepID=A0AAW2QG63_SESRA